MLKRNKKLKEEEFELVKLKSVGSEYELNLVKNLLEEDNIPFITKDEGAGSYLRISTGVSIFGTDILVPEPELERAKQALDTIEWE